MVLETSMDLYNSKWLSWSREWITESPSILLDEERKQKVHIAHQPVNERDPMKLLIAVSFTLECKSICQSCLSKQSKQSRNSQSSFPLKSSRTTAPTRITRISHHASSHHTEIAHSKKLTKYLLFILESRAHACFVPTPTPSDKSD
jgi:hypothetical protein